MRRSNVGLAKAGCNGSLAVGLAKAGCNGSLA